MDATSHNPLISTSPKVIPTTTTMSHITSTIAYPVWGTSLAQSFPLIG